jgi:serine/threonine protein kinase
VQRKNGSVFIRKAFKLHTDPDKTKTKFHREIKSLLLLQRIKHPNIVELLCAYTYNSEHSLLFPCLDMDLSHFLSRHERYGMFTADVTFYQALQGLASALHNVHNLKLSHADHEIDIVCVGYHHDIRPANILVTERTFKLADFGLSKMKTIDVGSQTEWKVGGGDYTAPECMKEDFIGQRVGRAIDVWAFGCLLVEVATYMVGGADLVESARQDRCCVVGAEWNLKNSYFWLGTDLKPSVALHMNKLQTNAWTADSDVSDLITTASLTLQTNFHLRPTSGSVFDGLSFLATKKLYESARTSLQNYIDLLRKNGESGPPILIIEFEAERLKLWGWVLRLDKPGLSSEYLSQHLRKDEISRIQDLLGEIEKKAKTGHQISLEYSETANTDLSIDFALYSQLHDALRAMTVSLCEILPPYLLKRIDNMWLATTTSTDSINDLSKSVEASLEVEQPEYEELRAFATIKNLRLALRELSASDRDISQALVDENQIEEERVFHDHEIGWLVQRSGDDNKTNSRQTRVLIERVSYSLTWAKQSPKERARRITDLVKLLRATPKPRDFCVLDCLGYTEPSESDEAYKFIFAYPTTAGGVDANVIHDTLFLKLQQARTKQGKYTQRPSLTQRVVLAQKLSRSLHAFHTAGWLHKTLNSTNVIFFSRPADAGSPSLAEPFIVNFRFSRPDGPCGSTSGSCEERRFAMYQHPEYISRLLVPSNPSDRVESDARFQKRYDYYSLGIILLEIGSWEPIDSYSDRHPTDPPPTFREKLIHKYAPRLEIYMGRLYTEATMACLEGNFGQDGVDSTANRTTRFFEKVVEPLSRIYVG